MNRSLSRALAIGAATMLSVAMLPTVAMAQSVAVALDGSGWPEVAGTISGDDTIFVATGTLRQQQ